LHVETESIRYRRQNLLAIGQIISVKGDSGELGTRRSESGDMLCPSGEVNEQGGSRIDGEHSVWFEYLIKNYSTQSYSKFLQFGKRAIHALNTQRDQTYLAMEL